MFIGCCNLSGGVACWRLRGVYPARSGFGDPDVLLGGGPTLVYITAPHFPSFRLNPCPDEEGIKTAALP